MKNPDINYGIIIPDEKHSLHDYKEITENNVIDIFQLDNDLKRISLDGYLNNIDHGAIHTYNVYKKSLDIVKQIESVYDVKVNKTLLYIMSGMHDSGRFRLSMIKNSDSNNIIKAKENKRAKAESEHAEYGLAQIKLGIKRLKEKNIKVTTDDQKKIEDYVLNHDFFNERLDGDKYHEPNSLEGQITRLADRISVPIEEEIQRYWETGKRLNTPYFRNDIAWQERVNFNFDNMKDYIKSGKFDEFTFFLALLSQKASDFSHPMLSKIYQDWSVSKNKGIDAILNIAKDEGYDDSDINKMKILLFDYLKYFDIKF